MFGKFIALAVAMAMFVAAAAGAFAVKANGYHHDPVRYCFVPDDIAKSGPCKDVPAELEV